MPGNLAIPYPILSMPMGNKDDVAAVNIL